MVTHRHIDGADIDEALDRVARAWGELSGARKV
jgi:hypothetical protein